MHHHVIAVQDWGGSQERTYGYPDPLTRDEGERLAADMAEADRLVYELGHSEAAYRLYGDRVPDLISGNICPGWEAIWLLPCADQCQFEKAFEQDPASWGEPHWRPTAAHSRVLTLVTTSKEN